jgi:hypothetical protein
MALLETQVDVKYRVSTSWLVLAIHIALVEQKNIQKLN